MTDGISLISGKTGAHRAPLQLIDPSFSCSLLTIANFQKQSSLRLMEIVTRGRLFPYWIRMIQPQFGRYEMFCDRCGAKLDDSAAFCSGCGKLVGTTPLT